MSLNLPCISINYSPNIFTFFTIFRNFSFFVDLYKALSHVNINLVRVLSGPRVVPPPRHSSLLKDSDPVFSSSWSAAEEAETNDHNCQLVTKIISPQTEVSLNEDDCNTGLLHRFV